MDLRSIWPTGDLRQGMPMCRMCQSTAGLGDASLQLRQLAAAISSQARRLVGEMSSPANRESLRSRTTTSDTASQGSRLSFSPTLLSLYIAISTEVLIAGDCVLLYVSQCTTVCWGLLCLHSGSIPAGFHHPGDPRYRPGSGADTCDRGFRTSLIYDMLLVRSTPATTTRTIAAWSAF